MLKLLGIQTRPVMVQLGHVIRPKKGWLKQTVHSYGAASWQFGTHLKLTQISSKPVRTGPKLVVQAWWTTPARWLDPHWTLEPQDKRSPNETRKAFSHILIFSFLVLSNFELFSLFKNLLWVWLRRLKRQAWQGKHVGTTLLNSNLVQDISMLQRIVLFLSSGFFVLVSFFLRV